jgi:hypothetical protein
VGKLSYLVGYVNLYSFVRAMGIYALCFWIVPPPSPVFFVWVAIVVFLTVNDKLVDKLHRMNSQKEIELALGMSIEQLFDKYGLKEGDGLKVMSEKLLSNDSDETILSEDEPKKTDKGWPEDFGDSSDEEKF